MFTNRTQAGEQLAKKLKELKDDAVVLALPRGGIVPAAEIAKQLQAPLGLVLVRKIGHPFSSEYAIGALAEDRQPVLNPQEAGTVSKQWLEDIIQKAKAENERRRKLYYKGLEVSSLKGKTVIVVDDGIATGWTMRAALEYVKSQGAKKVIVAVPVSAEDSLEMIKPLVDKTIVLEPPRHFAGAVGMHYQTFDQVEDEEVIAILRSFNQS